MFLVGADRGRIGSSVWAKWAWVRSFPGVGPNVPLQVVAGTRPVVAVRAAVRPLPGMDPQVQLEFIASATNFAANWALQFIPSAN